MSRGTKIGAITMAGLLAISISAPAQAVDAMVKPTANLATTAENAIRVSSVKGNSLKAGDRTFLMIGPYGEDYTAVSNAPEIVDAEQVQGFWVAVARAEGKATITVTRKDGASAGIEITVGTEREAQSAKAAGNTVEQAAALDANMEIRQEMIRLINAARRESGAAELPVNDALMDAAQDISAQRFTKHEPEYESNAAIRYGYPHGVCTNLTRFNGLGRIESIAEHAVGNWINSTCHRQTLLDADVDCLGVGVTVYNGSAYCVMQVGDDQSVNAYG